MSYLLQSIRYIFFMTLVCGLIYPITMTGLSQVIFHNESNGQLINLNDHYVGSLLIGQKFEKNEYFWPRPSAIDYNPIPSGGSNLSLASDKLRNIVTERINKLKSNHREQIMEPPQDLIFASASGIDPHISPAAAEYQMQRVAHARNRDVLEIRELIQKSVESPILGFLGEPKINVLKLNLSLDQMK